LHRGESRVRVTGGGPSRRRGRHRVDVGTGPAAATVGGSVAYQTACRLAAAGRHVGFVGLLDSRRVDMAQPDRLRRYARLLAASVRSWRASSRLRAVEGFERDIDRTTVVERHELTGG
jgi:hypothetical protein